MTSRRRTLVAIGLVVGVALLLVYGLVDPASHEFFPKCPLRALTGVDCPGCGSQRALHALIHGDIGAAWHFNAAIFVGVPLMALLAWAELRREQHPRLYGALYHPAVIAAIGVAIVAWWIVRNL